MVKIETDVFVLGGGPAGLAAAIAARRQGFRAALADSGCPPLDKACGEGLMPDSLAAAAELGIDIPPGAGHPFRGIRFVGSGGSVEAAFPSGSGLGVRRTSLHSILVRTAEQAGVEMFWRTPVGSLEGIRAKWIAGADGAQSRLRRWVSLDQVRRESARFAFRRHYHLAPWSEFMEIHWGEGCQFYITPVAADQVCVVLISRDSHLRIDAALRSFPALQDRLAGALPAGPERGSPASTRRLARVTRGNAALIGDASGTVDPITGEGLCLAFEQAAALGQAWRKGGLEHYERAHARLARRPLFMAEFMLLLDRSERLRRRALSALATRPDLFANLLAMHVGRLSAGRFAATAASLGWEVLTA